MKTNSAILAALLALAVTTVSTRAEEKTNATPSRVTHADAKEAAQLVAKGEVTVLDIRTPKEFARGHIAGATNLDFYAKDFTAQLAKLDREKPCLVHCATGFRSTKSLPEFEKLGFKRVVHLDGGFTAWQAAGNSIEKDR